MTTAMVRKRAFRPRPYQTAKALANAAARFDAAVALARGDAGPDECWPWRSGRLANGYGRWSLMKRSYQAHRYAYERLVGPVPADLTLDHLCRNRACINPAHLEPVTPGENVRRGFPFHERKDRCLRGHEYTRTVPRGNGMQQVCRECGREYEAAYRQRRRERLLIWAAMS